jgi:hypothetical protein
MYIFEQILVFWFNILFFIDFQKLYDLFNFITGES